MRKFWILTLSIVFMTGCTTRVLCTVAKDGAYTLTDIDYVPIPFGMKIFDKDSEAICK